MKMFLEFHENYVYNYPHWQRDAKKTRRLFWLGVSTYTSLEVELSSCCLAETGIWSEALLLIGHRLKSVVALIVLFFINRTGLYLPECESFQLF
jgi:hypothetical protein